MNPDTHAQPHTVYRCYDADDRLIYIGTTSTTVAKRLAGHRSSNPAVAEQTARWTEEVHPDRETALNAEANAIYNETPPLNYRFNPKRSLLAGMTRVDPPTPEELQEVVSRLASLDGFK